jgi:hypothetical protein
MARPTAALMFGLLVLAMVVNNGCKCGIKCISSTDLCATCALFIHADEHVHGLASETLTTLPCRAFLHQAL